MDAKPLAGTMRPDPDPETYGKPEIVARYDRDNELQPAEQLLFNAHLRPGMAILDVGVGAGRTTLPLASLASRYVGIDRSEAMIQRCREKFPGLCFLVQDATHMPVFPDSSFDAVAFSFNGLGLIPPGEGRDRCLRECARVLRNGGILIFSIHNARYLIFAPLFAGAGPVKGLWRILYAMAHTGSNLLSRLPSRAFWTGAGYVWDPLADGGLRHYVSTPQLVIGALRPLGFEVVEVVAAPDPETSMPLATPWYYYACVKRPPGGSPE